MTTDPMFTVEWQRGTVMELNWLVTTAAGPKPGASVFPVVDTCSLPTFVLLLFARRRRKRVVGRNVDPNPD